MSSYNTFNSMKPILKESYSDESKKKKRFGRTKNALKKGIMKSMSEASKDPIGYAQKTEKTNLSGLKGFAF